MAPPQPGDLADVARRPVRRGRAVVQHQQGAGGAQFDPVVGVVTLSAAVAAEHVEGRVPVEQPPAPVQQPHPGIVLEHLGCLPDQAPVPPDRDQAPVRPGSAAQPGRADPAPIGRAGPDRLFSTAPARTITALVELTR